MQYTQYDILKIDTNNREMLVRFKHDMMRPYYSRRSYEGEMDETKLQGLLELMQAEANSLLNVPSDNPPYVPVNGMSGTLKEIVINDIPEYDPARETLEEYWTETETTRTRVLEVRPLNDTELGRNARQRRNTLLAETDIEALGDRSLSTEMRTYREALRNITDQEGWPAAIVWPVKPIG